MLNRREMMAGMGALTALPWLFRKTSSTPAPEALSPRPDAEVKADPLEAQIQKTIEEMCTYRRQRAYFRDGLPATYQAYTLPPHGELYRTPGPAPLSASSLGFPGKYLYTIYPPDLDWLVQQMHLDFSQATASLNKLLAGLWQRWAPDILHPVEKCVSWAPNIPPAETYPPERITTPLFTYDIDDLRGLRGSSIMAELLVVLVEDLLWCIANKVAYTWETAKTCFFDKEAPDDRPVRQQVYMEHTRLRGYWKREAYRLEVSSWLECNGFFCPLVDDLLITGAWEVRVIDQPHLWFMPKESV